MISKKIDMALIGKSYLSFILSLELLGKGKKVLLLDDKRIGYGGLYTTSLRMLEAEYLREWGGKRKIAPLNSIDNYLKMRPLTLVFGNNRVRLGNTPARNLMELYRKLPLSALEKRFGLDVIERPYGRISSDPEGFNRSFEEYAKRLAQSFFRQKHVKNLKIGDLLDGCPPEITELYQFFARILSLTGKELSKEQWTLRLFIYIASAFFHCRPSYHPSKVELFHLLLSLLSPQHELNHEKLLVDLDRINQEQGGDFKKTHMRDIVFHKNRPWMMELGSYEGIVGPKEVSLLGGETVNMPLTLKPSREVFSCLLVDWTFRDDCFKEWSGERFLFSSLEKIGTQQPLYEVTVFKKRMLLSVFVAKGKGMIAKQVLEKLRPLILKELPRFIAMNTDDIIEERVEFSHNILLGEKDKFSLGESTVRLDGGDKVKKVHYFGPCKDASLGVLTSMLEITKVNGICQ